MMLLGWGVHSAAWAGSVHGWRHDGTGRVPDVQAPTSWTPVWRTPLPGWSNASPVALGELVCAMSEPTRLVCVNADDGTIAWTADHPVVDALTGPRAAEARASLAGVEGMEAEHDGLLKAASALKRQLRRQPDAADVLAALAGVQARLDVTRAALDATRWLRTPQEDEMIGYTTPTPLSDGARIWVWVTNGVLACHRADGSLVWSRFLGPVSPVHMRGYDRGQSASPVMVGGTLVVPWGHLMGLDPDTGATRWTDPAPWRDFGTPATTTVGGVPLVFTPEGRMLRASDGQQLAQDLGDVYYVGPYAVGDRVYYIGGPASDATSRLGRIPQHAWSLSADGAGGVVATRLWSMALTLKEVFYAGPVAHGDALYSVDKSGMLRVIAPSTGEVRHSVDLLPALGGWTYPSPAAVGGLVWIGSGKGRFLAVGPDGSILHDVDVGEQTRATPLFVRGAVYVRTLEGLVRYGAR